MAGLDTAFIQSIEHRPKTTIFRAEGIPMIDLSVKDSTDPDVIAGLVAEIGNACKDWGFFIVVNHGLPVEICGKLKEAVKKFFDQPTEEKSKVRSDEENPMGYSDGEHTNNVKDWKEVFDFVVHEPMVLPASTEPDDKEVRKLNNRWPHYPPELREICEVYAKEVEKLSFTLLELISKSLGLAADRLNDFFKDQISGIRFNYYPPCPNPDLVLGVGPHKDAGALTVLAVDDVGGLEVKRKTDGEWVRVDAIPDVNYIINIGDIIEDWSNGKYESVVHRVVVNTDKERYSIPFFFDPSHYTVVEPLKELINEQNPPKYKPYNYGKYLAERFSGNLKKPEVAGYSGNLMVAGNSGNLKKAKVDENIKVPYFRVSAR